MRMNAAAAIITITEKESTMLSHSAAETEEIGYRFGSSLRNGDCISLTGSLGAGKTVLAKGIARALGITEPIVSPTFTLVQEYDGAMKLYHLDLYRLSGDDEFESMGGEEFLYPDGITLIEWAEKIEDMMPDDAFRVTVAILEDGSRSIEIEGGRHEHPFS